MNTILTNQIQECVYATRYSAESSDTVVYPNSELSFELPTSTVDYIFHVLHVVEASPSGDPNLLIKLTQVPYPNDWVYFAVPVSEILGLTGGSNGVYISIYNNVYIHVRWPNGYTFIPNLSTLQNIGDSAVTAGTMSPEYLFFSCHYPSHNNGYVNVLYKSYSYNNDVVHGRYTYRKISYPLVYTTINTDQYTITTYTYEYHIIGSTANPYDQSISGDFSQPYWYTSHYAAGACDLTNTVLFEDCKSGYVDQKLGWYSFNDDGNPLVIKDKPKTLVNVDYNQSVGTFSTSQVSGWDGQWEPPLYVIIQWDTATMKEMDCLKLFNFDENYHAFVYYNGSMETVHDGEFYILRLFEYEHTSTSSYTKDNKEWLKLEGTNTLAYTKATTAVGPNNYGGTSEDNCLNACYVNTPGEFYGRYFYYNTSSQKWIERRYVPYVWRNLEPFWFSSGTNTSGSVTIQFHNGYYEPSTSYRYDFTVVPVDYITNEIYTAGIQQGSVMASYDSTGAPYDVYSFTITIHSNQYKYYIFRCDNNVYNGDNPTGPYFYFTWNIGYVGISIGGNLTSLWSNPSTAIDSSSALAYFTNQGVKFWHNQKVNGRGKFMFAEDSSVYASHCLRDTSRLEFPFYFTGEGYYGMFKNCYGLDNTPTELPALKAVTSSGAPRGLVYREMFDMSGYHNGNITQTPVIYLTSYTHGETALAMFKYCQNLYEVYLKTSGSTDSSTANVIGYSLPNGTDTNSDTNDMFAFVNNNLTIYKLPYTKTHLGGASYSTNNFNGFCGLSTNYTVTVADITDNTNSTSVLLSNVKRN